MYGTGVVVTARTCVLLPVRNRIWRCYCLVFDEVWGRNLILMRYFAVQIHYNNDHNDCALSLNIWTGCHVGPEQTARTFALRLNLKVLLAFNIVWSRNNAQQWQLITTLCQPLLLEHMERVSCRPWMNRAYVCACRYVWAGTGLNFVKICIHDWGRNLILIHHAYTVQTIYYNGDDDSALIFARQCIGRASCWLWTNSSYVCSHCCVCDWPYWTGSFSRSIQYEVLCYSHVPFCCSNGLRIVVLALDEQLVCLYCCMCVLEFESVIAWRSMQYKIAISPLCTILLSNGNDGSALIFIC